MPKNCYCHTCQREIKPLGIARHRATHRDRREDCKITYSAGDTFLHNYSLRPGKRHDSKESGEKIKNTDVTPCND